jgi:hypothetical protein
MAGRHTAIAVARDIRKSLTTTLMIASTTHDPLYGSVAYRRLTDISTGLEMPNSCAGYRVPDSFIDQVQYRPNS